MRHDLVDVHEEMMHLPTAHRITWDKSHCSRARKHKAHNNYITTLVQGPRSSILASLVRILMKIPLEECSNIIHA